MKILTINEIKKAGGVPINTVIQGDCLEIMPYIKQGSIDAIITDPPFGITACKWDTIIPLDVMWIQLKRIIKDKGAIALFGSEPFSSVLRMSNIENFKYDWYWRKPRGTGHLNAKKMPMNDTEIISVFYKKTCLYNPQFTKGEPYTALKGGKVTKIKIKGSTTYGTFKEGASHRNDNSGFRYPKRGIDFGVVERGTVHPTQKPVKLIEYLIKTYTNEGDTVLDFTAGSFTTAVAAENLKRNWICIEKEKKYCEIGRERIIKNRGLFHQEYITCEARNE